MELRHINKDKLLTQMHELVHSERLSILSVLHHLKEIERRHLFAELGFSSLYDYCVKELAYSEASAHRRISSMRLLKDLPEIEPQIASGALSLSTLASAKSFFRIEKMQSKGEKLKILGDLARKSSKQVQKVLMAKSTQPTKYLIENVRQVSSSESQVSVVLDDKTLRQVDELKELLAHKKPHISLGEILAFAVDFTLERHQARRSNRPTLAKPLRHRSPPPSELTARKKIKSASDSKLKNRSRYIPAEIKRQIWLRDHGECGYIDPQSGRRCASKFALQIDHILPYAKGGESELKNLRLRCAAHNQQEALKVYGIEKMAHYIPRLR